MYATETPTKGCPRLPLTPGIGATPKSIPLIPLRVPPLNQYFPSFSKNLHHEYDRSVDEGLEQNRLNNWGRIETPEER